MPVFINDDCWSLETLTTGKVLPQIHTGVQVTFFKVTLGHLQNQNQKRVFNEKCGQGRLNRVPELTYRDWFGLVLACFEFVNRGDTGFPTTPHSDVINHDRPVWDSESKLLQIPTKSQSMCYKKKEGCMLGPTPQLSKDEQQSPDRLVKAVWKSPTRQDCALLG